MQALRMTQFELQRALVVGLGLTGLSCARYLTRLGYQVTVVDNRDRPPICSTACAQLHQRSNATRARMSRRCFATRASWS